MAERLQKVIAEAGIASRRKAEKMICITNINMAHILTIDYIAIPYILHICDIRRVENL